MNLTQIKTWSEGFTDEAQTDATALAYANEVISILNTSFHLKLPFITDVSTEYTVLPESWFVRFMVSYLCYGIKMNDSSLSEAQMYKQKFDVAIYDFSAFDKSSLGEQYIDTASTSNYVIDTSYALNVGWFGNGEGETW